MGVTISKIIVILSIIGIVITLLYYVGGSPSLPTIRAYRQPGDERPVAQMARLVEDHANQPVADQPAADTGEKEEEKKPEKRDRYEVVKV